MKQYKNVIYGSYSIWCTKLCIFISSCLLLMTAPAMAWDLELMKAAHAVNTEGKGASERDKALTVQKNVEINQMRMKDTVMTEMVNGKKVTYHMSDDVYQSVQKNYDEKSQELAKTVVERNGATMKVQTRKPGSSFDAGTDSDYITTARSKEQVQNIQKDYNADMSEYLRKAGLEVSPNADFAKTNDVDFMVEQENVSKNEFEEIAKVNNDAYKRPKAAIYEAKVRSGQTPTIDEIMDYKDEMNDFVNKKDGQIQTLAEQVRKKELKRQELAETGKTENAADFKARMQAESKLQQTQAHKSKYLGRLQDASQELAKRTNGKASMEKSQLPDKGKIRAADETTSQINRQIDSAAADSMAEQIKLNDKFNESVLLADAAKTDPGKAELYKQRIVYNLAGMNPSQKNELLERIQITDSSGRPDNFTKDIVISIKKDVLLPPRSISTNKNGTKVSKVTEVPSVKSAKMGKVAGFAGDIMSIGDQIEKATQGSHLFINHEEDDSDTTKTAKNLIVGALELSPIPLIDALDRGFTVDIEEQEHIKKLIAAGKLPPNPLVSVCRVTGKIIWLTTASMTIDPLIEGVKAAEEFYKLGGSLMGEWDNSVQAEQNRLKTKEKFDEMIERMSDTYVSDIYAYRTSFKENSVEYPLEGSVYDGDTLRFTTFTDDSWSDGYDAQWQLTAKGKAIYSQVKKSTTKGANQIKFKCDGLPSGNYLLFFRIVNHNSGKVHGFEKFNFRIDEIENIVLSPIVATIGTFDGIPNKGKVSSGKILAFQVARKGTWSKQERVEWTINGDMYKAVSADDPKSNLLRFDASSLKPGEYKATILAVKNDKVQSHESFTFEIVSDEKLPPVKLKGFIGKNMQTPLSGSVQNSQVLAFKATVNFPKTETPKATELNWQVYDASNQPIVGAGKSLQTYETEGAKNYDFKFQLNDFTNGKYSVVLTHSLIENQKIKEEKSIDFIVSDSIRIDTVVIADNASGSPSLRSLQPSDNGYAFVYYNLSPEESTVNVNLYVKSKKSGEIIASMKQDNRPRKDKNPKQRIGLLIPNDKMQGNSNFIFVAELSTDKSPITKRIKKSFTLTPKEAQVARMNLPSTLTSGKYHRVSFTVPDGYEAPFTIKMKTKSVRFKSTGEGSLKGKVKGVTSSGSKKCNFAFTITDSRGFSAKGSAKAVIIASSDNRKEHFTVNTAGRKRSWGPSSSSRSSSQESADKFKEDMEKLRDSLNKLNVSRNKPVVVKNNDTSSNNDNSPSRYKKVGWKFDSSESTGDSGEPPSNPPQSEQRIYYVSYRWDMPSQPTKGTIRKGTNLPQIEFINQVSTDGCKAGWYSTFVLNNGPYDLAFAKKSAKTVIAHPGSYTSNSIGWCKDGW